MPLPEQLEQLIYFKFLKIAIILKSLYTSSSCVYGNGSNSVMKEDDYLVRNSLRYSIMLVSYMQRFITTILTVSVSLRVFNTYGPNEVSSGNVTSKFIDAALKNNPLHITGTGNEERDYTFVSDTADLLIKCTG